jgi:hypothetical protein
METPGFDLENEKRHWLSQEDLESLLEQTEASEPGSSTIRALVTEVLWLRKETQ